MTPEQNIPRIGEERGAGFPLKANESEVEARGSCGSTSEAGPGQRTLWDGLEIPPKAPEGSGLTSFSGGRPRRVCPRPGRRPLRRFVPEGVRAVSTFFLSSTCAFIWIELDFSDPPLHRINRISLFCVRDTTGGLRGSDLTAFQSHQLSN